MNNPEALPCIVNLVWNRISDSVELKHLPDDCAPGPPLQAPVLGTFHALYKTVNRTQH